MLLLRSSAAFLYFFNAVQAGPVLRFANSLYHKLHDSTLPDNTTISDQGDCSNYCGLNNQICCPVGASCITDSNGNAECGPTHLEARQAALGYTSVYTTTLVTVDVATNFITITSLYTTFIATGQALETCAPNTLIGQVSCGVKCCDNGYYCYNTPSAICSPLANDYTSSGGVVVVGGGTVAIRPTTISGLIITQSVSQTFTTSLTPAIPGNNNGTIFTNKSSHISGGAIAGIVIGVLLAITILFWICVCCCLKAGIDGILSFFGLRGRRSRRSSRETIVEEEVIRRHRQGGTDASGNRRWVGSGSGSYDRRSRRSRPAARERRTGWAPLAALGGLGGLFALNRARDRRTEKSHHSGSSYDSYYSGTVSADSRDRRTRRSSRSRR